MSELKVTSKYDILIWMSGRICHDCPDNMTDTGYQGQEYSHWQRLKLKICSSNKVGTCHRAREEGGGGSGGDKFNDDLRFTTALAWFSCVN